jgi:pimeloyl-ACP methyl ester carboxylesterase
MRACACIISTKVQPTGRGFSCVCTANQPGVFYIAKWCRSLCVRVGASSRLTYSDSVVPTNLIERLDLKNITIVCQDWGGLLGLTLPLDIAARVGGVIAMNTMLVTGEIPLPDAFGAWKQWAADHPDMDPGEAMQVIDDTLPSDILDAYRAPFPNERSKAGPRSFPKLVPVDSSMPGADIARCAVTWWQNEWRGDALVACGLHDKILSLPVMQLLASWIKDCPPVLEVPEAGHFCQEHGAVVAEKYLELYGDTPVPK